RLTIPTTAKAFTCKYLQITAFESSSDSSWESIPDSLMPVDSRFRFPKSGSDWTGADLDAYNITVKKNKFAKFFEGAFSAQASDSVILEGKVDANILNARDFKYREDDSEAAREYFSYLRLTQAIPNHETLIDDLIRETLKITGYKNTNHTFINTGFITPLHIARDPGRVAQTDVSLMHQNSQMLLVIVENKTKMSKAHPEAQVIAEAIAAFQYNNSRRAAFRLTELNEMVIPAITVIGSTPNFYLIPVTTALSNAVRVGDSTAHNTLVQKCTPTLDKGLSGDKKTRNFTLRCFLVE
ncbi:hypothetical protein H0H92_009693, partial [Tricholoma furcatifolium]